MTKVKICGLKTMEEIQIVNEFPVDYAGFIFVPKSKRYVNIKQAKKLIKELNPSITKVGVFQNETLETVRSTVEQLDLDIVQLHGKETVEYAKEIPCKVWKVISVADAIDFDLVNAFGFVDGILFDTKVGEQEGGTGVPFSWNLVKDLNMKPKKIVAGGLYADNVKQAIRETKADIVDLNSKLEVDGIKTRRNIQAVFEQLGGCNE